MADIVKARISVKGIVQGVGFRPFVYRLAHEHGLPGWVLNCSSGVEIEVEGTKEQVVAFARDVRGKAPPLSKVIDVSSEFSTSEGLVGFAIRESVAGASKSTLISPDIGICDDCLRELFDPDNRRHLYPFINCTNCGPRYTIIRDIPYDRPKTTMSTFVMCTSCQGEYDDPLDRRFHAQPNACWECGPRLSLVSHDGKEIGSDDPIAATIDQLKQGRIAAIKGLGGFHLAVDAENDEAVRRLRRRKMREAKALAIMALDTRVVGAYCHIKPEEEAWLTSQRRPIVLLEKKKGNSIAESVAPGNRFLGVMLPYAPVHYLILKNDFGALVMTSGNLTDEPIAMENGEALRRLREIADCFLVNDRDIYLRTDDSVIRVFQNREMPLRRSRGFVPVPVHMDRQLEPILAVGAEMKNTICLSRGNAAFVSQHIGDLENLETYEFFRMTIDHLKRILEVEPRYIAYDLHPEYLSTKFALEQDDLHPIGVQHHHAHCVSCMAEHDLSGAVIGVSFDGTGYGLDGNIWGGEFLVAERHGFTRKGHLRYIPMPGGAAAIREPWRMAIGFLHTAFGSSLKDQDIGLVRNAPENHVEILLRMISSGVNCPQTSSCGRLFDTVSALLNVTGSVSYEGQAAIELELLAQDNGPEDRYDFGVDEAAGVHIVDTVPVIAGVVADVRKGTDPAVISTRFHNTVASIVCTVCQRIADSAGLDRVVLSGGVFQNYFLLSKTVAMLSGTGFRAFTHSAVPANDGGIALGQLAVADEMVRMGKSI